MAEAADEEGEGKQTKKPTGLGAVVPIHKKISDVGQYSYAALCATALSNLFDSDCHRKFIEESLAVILVSLEQPQQVCESVQAMALGHAMDDMDPYVDVLLAEPVLSEGREDLISQLLAIAIGQGCYDARMRVLIKHIAWRLRTSWDTLEDLESQMSESLAFAQYQMSAEEKEEKLRKEKRRKLKRFALIGLATVGGGTLIGLTGGLAAPLVAAGAGALIGGTSAAVLGSATGVALIGSLFGVAGAGLTGYKMKRRVGAIEEFEFEQLLCGNNLRTENLSSQLHITIAVTGWLSNSMRDFRQPWKHLAESREQYTLRWETKYLVQLGEALDYVFNSAMAMATQEALKHTVLQGLLAAVAWPAALISASNIIDNPWSVALHRAQAAGGVLAEVLLAREQGKRPVTLIGYSLGARVIFSCLKELSKRKGSEGIVEDVVLLGTPASGDPAVWKTFKPIIAGKIVNGYCRGDWLLKFLYRTSSVQMSIAGLRPVEWSDRRMHNIDLSDVVNGHMDYRNQLDVIMKAVGVRTKDDVVHPSKRKSCPKASPGSDPYDVAMSDLSSSDDDLLTEPEVAPSGEPVVLEDYTLPEGIRSLTGSVASGSTIEDPSRGNMVPESASFDSGVDIHRAKSASKENLSCTDGMVEDASSPLASSSLTNPDETSFPGAGEDDPDKSHSALMTTGVDRIGDASAVGNPGHRDSDDEDEDFSYLNASDEPTGSTSDLVSNLQRKKLFDSMYRLVIDSDLEDISGEEDNVPNVDGSSDEDAKRESADAEGS